MFLQDFDATMMKNETKQVILGLISKRWLTQHSCLAPKKTGENMHSDTKRYENWKNNHNILYLKT